MSYEFMICYDTLPEINTLDWTFEGFLSPFADKGPTHNAICIEMMKTWSVTKFWFFGPESSFFRNIEIDF